MKYFTSTTLYNVPYYSTIRGTSVVEILLLFSLTVVSGRLNVVRGLKHTNQIVSLRRS
jgi:hypothetical protein